MTRKTTGWMCLLLWVVGAGSGLAQVASQVDRYRQAQWHPEKGRYYFSHALIYEYLNKTDSTRGELWIFLDPVTGTMCFQRESSFGASDDMNEAILALPDGRVIACGKDEAGKARKVTFRNTAVKPNADEIRFQRENFKTQCVATGRTRKEFGWASREYVLSYLKSSDKSKLWLAEVSFGVYPLYAFDVWGGDARLPISLAYHQVVSSKYLVTELNDKYTYAKLVSFESNPYYLDLSKYPGK